MTRFITLIAASLAAAAFASGAEAQSVRDVVGPTPWAAAPNEPPPKLFIDPPHPDLLARGAIVLPYRVENLRIVPVFGAAALDLSPRVGHLHIAVDDLPWHWADAGDSNTIVIVGLPPGPHTITVDVADPRHGVLIRKVVAVTVPPSASSHPH